MELGIIVDENLNLLSILIKGIAHTGVDLAGILLRGVLGSLLHLSGAFKKLGDVEA